jgi:hypothetical protein
MKDTSRTYGPVSVVSHVGCCHVLVPETYTAVIATRLLLLLLLLALLM